MPKISKKIGGRPMNPIWSHFHQFEDESGKLTVTCKACNQTVSAKADRMKKHQSETCPKLKMNSYGSNCSQSNGTSRLDPNIRAIRDDNDTQETIVAGQSINSQFNTTVKHSAKKYQPSVSDFVIHTSVSQKEQIDIKIAQFFYACNIPFSTIENRYFIDMLAALRPGYKSPSRKNLAGDLLAKVTDELEETALKNLSGKSVTLMQDGWSNVHNDPVIANSIYCNGKSIFISAVDCGSNKKTSEYCTNLAREAKSTAETKYGCNVKSFVSDSENKMVAMRENLQKEDVVQIAYGCSAHYLNLLGNAVSTDTLMAHVVKVQKYFRNHHIPSGLLKEYPQSVKPQIPGETRWNSQMTCIESFLTNRAFYLQIVDKHEDLIEDNIKHIINNVYLHKDVKNMYNQLQPVGEALNRLQNDSTNIADACDIFIDILNNEHLKPHLKKVKSIFHAAITPVHFLAHMMNPKYKGKKLTQTQEESARKYLQDINPQYVPYTIQFQSEEMPFPKTYFSLDVINSVSPSLWWKNLKKSGIDLNFLELMEHLQGCPASLERVFSHFALIQNKLRNRLGLETTSKLVFCYMMLKSKESQILADW